MEKRVFLYLPFLCLFFSVGSLYSQSIESNHGTTYWERFNNNSFFVGGGYLGNEFGWNGIIEYRQRILNSGFSFQPAFVSYGSILESDRFGYKTNYANLQLSANFTYSFARIMKISFFDIRLGVGVAVGTEYVQPNPIYNTKTWNVVVGPNAVAMLGFLITHHFGIGLRYQFNYLPQAQVNPIEHMLSLGLIIKLP